MIVEGVLLTGRSFEPREGRLVIEDGRIAAIEEERVASDHLLVPAFVNAHTHIGDSIAKEAGAGLSLAELVAPPDGLKHRLLRAAEREELIAGMRRSVRLMASTGTAAFADFREGGIDGVSALREATDGIDIEGLAFGRDERGVLSVADGYGASGAADADFTDERRRAREAGKPFAIHAGENRTDDIEPALDLDPDLLVHMVQASDDHLRRVQKGDTPVVICPRSNLVSGVGLPPIEALTEHTTVALGTDNVMLNAPSIFREMEFTAKLTDLPAPTVLGMATHAGAEVLGLGCGTIEEGKEARVVVLDGDSDNLAGARDPVRAVVRRAGADDVVDVL